MRIRAARCSPWCRRRASRPPTANGSSARPPNLSTPNASTPIGRNSRSALGSFLAKRGRPARRRNRIQSRAAVEPAISPAAVNLADLYRGSGGKPTAKLCCGPRLLPPRRMRACITRLASPWCGSNEATRRSANCAAPPTRSRQARYAYVYAVALHSVGRSGEAMTELKENLARHPNDRDTCWRLSHLAAMAGTRPSARLCRALARIAPRDRGLAALIEELRRQAGKPNEK